MPKKPKGGTLWSHLYFWKHLNRSHALRLGRRWKMNKYERWTNCKKSGPLRVRLSTEKNKKKLLTVRVGLFSLREKAPTKKWPTWPNKSARKTNQLESDDSHGENVQKGQNHPVMPESSETALCVVSGMQYHASNSR